MFTQQTHYEVVELGTHVRAQRIVEGLELAFVEGKVVLEHQCVPLRITQRDRKRGRKEGRRRERKHERVRRTRKVR